jgi:hypothetical protein
VGNNIEILFQKLGNTYEIRWGIIMKLFCVYWGIKLKFDISSRVEVISKLAAKLSIASTGSMFFKFNFPKITLFRRIE